MHDLLPSWRSGLKDLPPDQLFSRLRQELQSLPDEECAKLLYDWQFWARPNQLPPPGDWFVWLVLAGRGWGKTRAGAEFCIAEAQQMPGSRGAIVAETPAQARDVMVELGESSILACSPPWFRPEYEPSKRRLTWPNGTTASIYSAFEYEELRGPQHHWAWVDELAKFTHAQEAWDNLVLGLRLPPRARCCVTTTPRPIGIIKKLLKDSTTVVSRGSTYENLQNLSGAFRKTVLERYEGTRLGRQELNAEVLEDLEGALWSHDRFDRLRISAPKSDELGRIIVAVDPSGGAEEGTDEQGITVQALMKDGRGVLLADRSCHLSPDGWGRQAVKAVLDHQADCIVAERNFGGEMVEHVIRTAAQAMGVIVRVNLVQASRGKMQRAEPVSALYEQGRVVHAGAFPQLEDQLCCFTPQGYVGEGSPDRADALIWGMTELMVGPPAPSYEGIPADKISMPWGPQYDRFGSRHGPTARYGRR